MKKLHNKEKTSKMCLVMLYVLLVSGAIVCSTNDNGNGGGENSESPFVCTNGQEVTDSNTTEGENIQNCASCDAGFTPTPVSGNTRTTCEPDSGFAFVCEDGTPADGTSTTENVENCATCTTPGFSTEPDETVASRMVCRTPYVCPNGTAVVDTITTANVESCSECDAGFEEAMQDDGRMICQPGFACPNGVAVMATADNMPTAAGEENCASCNTDDGFTREEVQGSNRMVCRTPYVCPNGTPASSTTTVANVENCTTCTMPFTPTMSGSETVCRAPYVCPNGTPVVDTITMANVENCASCTMPFTPTTSGSETVCRTPFVCPSGTPASGTTAMADIENCSACDPGFGTPQSSGSESICSGNELPIALWNAGRHDGDFGFGLCQNRINAGSADAIGSDLNNRGYTKAVFFGSTTTYNFPDIGSDTDALALSAMSGS